MSVNLISLLQNEFSDEAISRVGSFLGDGPAKAKAGLGYAIPAVVAGLTEKAQTSQGAAELFGMLQRGNFGGTTSGTVASLLGTGVPDLAKMGGPLVASLFGARKTGLTEWISGATGLGAQSSTSLLAVAVPMVLSVLGREATKAGGFNLSSVTKLLGGQDAFVRSVAPPGLYSVIGSHEPARAYGEPVRVSTEPARAYEREGGLGWLKWALPLLLLALLAWGFGAWRSRDPVDPVGATAATSGARLPALASTTGTPALMKRTLCGRELDIAPNGVEAALIDHIDDKTRGVDKVAWFTFDRLEFETGSATLRPSSQAQAQNIAEILRCYRNVNLKIGGYTDNVGDPASNLKLSQARAETTRQAVLSAGIEPSRLEAEGYGEQFPVASNDTEQGRQRNRRIDVRVTKK